MRRAAVLSRSILAAGLLASGGATATTWSCGLTSAATQIECVAQRDPAPEQTAEAPEVTVRGTRFPLDRERVWRIDLWSPATDMDGVKRLASASMCYRSPNCSVVWRTR